MIPLKNNSNVDNSDLPNYPDGRIKDNTGPGNGTPVNRSVYGDLHSNISKLMRLYNIGPNSLPDNETNGYQIIEALSALASKNDYIYSLTTNGTNELSVDIKLSLMKDNEFLICLAAADKTTETTVKGSNNTSLAVTYSGNFKANEYVRLIKTGAGVTIIRIADWNSLNAMVNELGYLKKASQAQEDAGTSDLVSTTPLVNKNTFIKRVNGTDSTSYLANSSRNGLMSKEQYDVVANVAGGVKSKVLKLNSWSLDRQFTVPTGFTGSEVIIGINAFIECTTANNGFVVGDIVTAPTPYVEDAGRTAAQGIGFQFKQSEKTLFRVLVNDQVVVMQSWTSDGATANNFNIGNPTQWALRFIVFYI